jgi:hypothetical protein
VVSETGFTWAEPVVIDDTIFVAWGVAGETSVLVPISLDGNPRGPPRSVPLHHPSLLRPSAGGLFWMAFVSRATNAIEVAYVRTEGRVFRGPITIETGRYGSGHGAIARPDLLSHMVGYPREGPPGVRRGYVAEIDQSGAFAEQLLSVGDARAVLPVRLADRLALVRNGDELTIETADLESLARLETRTFPAIEQFLVAGTAADRLVLGYSDGRTMRFDDYGSALMSATLHDVPMPGSLGTGPTGVASYPDSVVFAIGLNEGTRSFPWLVRLECVP